MRADRLLTIILLLQQHGRLTARQLAERLEVSERTIYRDLDALSAAGVPVYATSGPGGGCMLDPRYRTSLTGLHADEVRSLALSGGSGPLADLGLGEARDRLVLKLLAGLPATQRAAAERVRQLIYLDPDPWFQRPEPVPNLTAVQDAVWAGERLRIGYRRRDGRTSERVVEPYGLVAKAGVWYLLALSDGDLRGYRVSRMVDIIPTGETFERDDDFDLPTAWTAWSAAFAGSLPRYPVTVRVAQALLEELSAEVAATAGPPDAEGWRVVTVHFDILEHARSWALGHGTRVEVLQPPELRAALAGVAAWLVERYAVGEDA